MIYRQACCRGDCNECNLLAQPEAEDAYVWLSNLSIVLYQLLMVVKRQR